jgi:RHS repeat-associated protein
LSIPRIETLVDGDQGWVIAGPADPGRHARCTRFDRPTYFGTLDDPEAGWNGMAMITEDGNEQTILKRAPQNTRRPAMTDANGAAIVFPAVTQDNWQVGCLPTTSNGQAGEGFFVVSPDGTKYWFDYLQYATAFTVAEPDPLGSGIILKQRRRVARMYATRIEDRFGNWVQYHYCNDVVAGCDGRVTSITAKDGRSVSIAWRADSPVISAITMQPGTTPARVWQYQYANITSTGASLSAAILPDGSRWSLNGFGPEGKDNYVHDADMGKCTTRQKTNPDGTGSTITMTAPSGLVGNFTLAPIWHARNYVPSYCMSPQHPGEEFEPYEQIAPLFKSATLTRKTFTGPGIAPQSWGYTYATAVGSTTTDACADSGTCPASTWVDVTGPDSNRIRYTYSNRWGESEGRLLRTDTYQGASTLLRTETYTHAAKDAGPWPSAIGGPMMDWRSNTAAQSYWMPLDRRTVVQQGVTFAHDVAAAGFDVFARDIDATDSNTQGHSRRTLTTYHDNQADWVLGQVATVTTGGIQSARTDYDAQDLPWKTYAFGKLKQTLAYYPDSTLKTVTDGNNHTTILSSWYRGVPRLITYADGESQSAVVNPYGWITSVTDEADATTSYGYDSMGRVNKITYPTGDTTAWSATTIAFAAVGSAEYGIAAGHWRQTISTGNGREITYFDAMWRPVLTREYDAGNVAATDRYVASSYDPAGHQDYTAYAMGLAPGMSNGYWISGGDAVTDTTAELAAIDEGTGSPRNENSEGTGKPEIAGNPDAEATPTLCYPQPDCEDPDPPPPPPPPPLPSISTLPGVHTTYDALGRVTAVAQDSELGVLATTTAYLSGFQVKVTNPRGYATTTTSYLAWDSPTTEYPLGMALPEGAYTDITRDPFGAPLSLTRRNSTGSLAVTRSYAYNANHELCRTVEPETGATLLGYDAAGNLAWSAAGLSQSTACNAAGDTTEILARKVLRQYDTRNRITALRFPDGLGDQDWQYTADGLPEQIVTYNGPGHTQEVTNAYGYNRRRLLSGESSTYADDGSTWDVGYGYDASAHLASQTYPDGRVAQYAPNALGQATQVDSGGSNPEAWGASYYPNGALKQFTYGNGIVHTLVQNARGLPERSTDAYGTTTFLDDSYDYDPNGNVAAITDGATGRNQRGNRDMGYDGLDRLTAVASPMYGSTGAAYAYDVLDNLTRVRLPDRNYYYCYDASNRLTNIKIGGCDGTTVTGLGYDVQGNLANRSGTQYAFDFGNRLRRASYNAATVEAYRYDGHGRRVLATSVDGAIASFYSQAGQLLYQDNRRDGKTHGYYYLAGSLVDELTRDTATGAYANRYQHTDALGSPVAVTNGPRTVLERSEYEPYGKLLNRPLADGPGYAGHVSDAATGLSYMQQRYYDPRIGVFLSVDPVTADGATGANFNRYWYGNSNPYRFTDPDGRQPVDDSPEHRPDGARRQSPTSPAPKPAPEDKPQTPVQPQVVY